MNQEVKKFVKIELQQYGRNKDIVNQVRTLDLMGHRQLLRNIIMIHVIDSALEELPNEIKEYAAIRYFKRSDYGYSMLASECNASERTVKRWDGILLKKVAEQLEGMGNVIYSCHLFGTKLAPFSLGKVLECDQQENDRARCLLAIKPKI